MEDSRSLEQTLSSLGVDTFGLSLDWLVADARAGGPLRWMHKRLQSHNVLTPELQLAYSEIDENEILTDDQLDIEFKKIVDENKYYNVNFSSHLDLNEENQKIDDLNQLIDLSSLQLETLEKNFEHRQALTSKFNKDLEYYKNLRNEKLLELSELTEECENLNQTLIREKCQLKDLTNMATKYFIDLGENNENQMKDEQYREYFLYCNHLDLFFHDHLHNNVDREFDMLFDKSKLSSSDTRSIDFEPNVSQVIVKCNKKMESAIYNYIRTKAELNKSQELLKFCLMYENNSNPSCLGTDWNKKIRTEYSEKDIQKTIRYFVKNQISNILFGDLKLNTTNIECLYEKLSFVESTVQNVNACGKLLMSSIKMQENKREEIISFFYSVVKLLMSDVITIQNREQFLEKLQSLPNEPYLFREFLHVKTELYKLFEFDMNMPLESVLEKIDSKFSHFNNQKDFMFSDQFTKILSNYRKSKKNMDPLKKFIWDGATSHPNMCNSVCEFNLYKNEQKVEEDSLKIKKASNIYKQLKDSSLTNSLSSTVKIVL